jgi:hypothetical protein
MKNSLSILILCFAVSANAQINAKTLALHKHYSQMPSYQLKLNSVPLSFQNNFRLQQAISPIIPIVSNEAAPKPSTHSIQKAFAYYNSLKKPQDYSGFLLTGYSIFTKQNVIGNVPQESIRFFPANTKD